MKLTVKKISSIFVTKSNTAKTVSTKKKRRGIESINALKKVGSSLFQNLSTIIVLLITKTRLKKKPASTARYSSNSITNMSVIRIGSRNAWDLRSLLIISI
jgi:hypothetical protein